MLYIHGGPTYKRISIWCILGSKRVKFPDDTKLEKEKVKYTFQYVCVGLTHIEAVFRTMRLAFLSLSTFSIAAFLSLSVKILLFLSFIYSVHICGSDHIIILHWTWSSDESWQPPEQVNSCSCYLCLINSFHLSDLNVADISGLR